MNRRQKKKLQKRRNFWHYKEYKRIKGLLLWDGPIVEYDPGISGVDSYRDFVKNVVADRLLDVYSNIVNGKI